MFGGFFLRYDPHTYYTGFLRNTVLVVVLFYIAYRFILPVLECGNRHGQHAHGRSLYATFRNLFPGLVLTQVGRIGRAQVYRLSRVKVCFAHMPKARRKISEIDRIAHIISLIARRATGRRNCWNYSDVSIFSP